ncbi:MAG: alpha/beta fold hydrolase [Pseudomonadota bacterium]
MNVLLVGAAIAALLFLVLAVGAHASLDRSGRYTDRAASLPVASADSDSHEGLVRIPVGDWAFRARVRNLSGQGDPVIMLHGWPQSSIAWEPLLSAAADQGHPAVAFDLRGYSPEARPASVHEYTVDKLVDDVCQVADVLGFERFHLVGHDWGAATGWALVMTRPERVISWAALSIPHSYSFLKALSADRDQRRRSAYILLFRLPWLPEALLAWGRHRVMRRLMYRFMPEAHAAEYVAMLAEPGALTAVLNFYRAMGKGKSMASQPEIDLPVLFVWGNRDPAAGRFAAEHQTRYMRGPYRFVELDGGHWLLERRTEPVVRAVLEHISAYRSA